MMIIVFTDYADTTLTSLKARVFSFKDMGKGVFNSISKEFCAPLNVIHCNLVTLFNLLPFVFIQNASSKDIFKWTLISSSS